MVLFCLFNNSGFFEDSVGAVFVDSFDGASRKSQIEILLELGHVNFLFLEVDVFAHFWDRVVLGSTRTV